MFGSQYFVGVWLTIFCWCLAHNILLVFGSQYFVDVWLTIFCWCLAHNILLIRAKNAKDFLYKHKLLCFSDGNAEVIGLKEQVQNLHKVEPIFAII